MTVPITTRKVEFSGNGVTTAFATTFRFLTNAHVVVKLKLSGGSFVTQVEGTHYTLTGAGLDAGGTVTMVVAPPASSTLSIERTVPLTQTVDFSVQGSFAPQTHEDEFDLHTHADQQLEGRIAALESISNPAPDFSAGAGLTLAATVLDVGAGNGIQVNADTVEAIYGAAADIADVTKAAEAAGALNKAARADHKHDVSTAAPAAGAVAIGNAAAEGTATSLARSDHVHAVTAPAAPADVTKAAASAGAATTFARADHKHDISTAVVATVGTANAEGSATSVARSDHVHNHGNQTTPAHHAVATTADNGFMSAADKTKLDNLCSAVVVGIAQTTDATPLDILSRTIGVGLAEYIEVNIVARRSTGAEACGYKIAGTFRRDGASAIQVSTTTALVTQEDAVALAVAFAITGASVRVSITGEAGKTFNWAAVAHILSTT
ncbi:MAG: hypothetical protein ACRD4T_00155 [Candidatus Acidiferrales bacterium]